VSAARLAAAYFGAQGVAVAAWWVLLWAMPATRGFFLPSGELTRAFLAFALPDVVVLGGGSVAAGVLIARADRRARVTLWVVVGALAYATLYTLAWWILTGAPVLSVALMVLALLGSTIGARRALQA